ncbi:MAG TPA: hypothetical protein VGQ21_01100 [Thermoanaerobaculia bacterium]|nr:hypothetical protein [Thermoanaerobaculia bacterium]
MTKRSDFLSALPRAKDGTLASSPAGSAASRRRTANRSMPAHASHSAAGTPPSQPAGRQRSGRERREDH